MFSRTVLPSASFSSSSASTSVGLAAAACATMSVASCWNCSFFATKSVSQLSWIIVPSAAATRPLSAARVSPRCCAFAAPLIRSASIALSKSPSASVRAFLLSIMPAPVRSRSFFTSTALMFAIARSLLSSSWVSPRSSCRGSPAAVPAPARRPGPVRTDASRRVPPCPAVVRRGPSCCPVRFPSGPARRPVLRPRASPRPVPARPVHPAACSHRAGPGVPPRRAPVRSAGAFSRPRSGSRALCARSRGRAVRHGRRARFRRALPTARQQLALPLRQRLVGAQLPGRLRLVAAL